MQKTFVHFDNSRVVYSMDTLPNPPESVSPARSRRLASAKASGKPLERWGDIEAEIERMLGLHESEWIAEAEDVQSETLVFLIRYIRQGDQEVYGRLMTELSRRIAHLVDRFTQTLDEVQAEYIAMTVEEHILRLVLIEKPTRQSDYLEVAFTKAVQRRATDAVRRYQNSVMGAHRGELVPDPGDIDLEDSEELERPIEFARDPGHTPEIAVLIADLAQKASGAVKDPRHLEAVILHYGHGWPVESSDPKKDDLVHYFNATARQIKYWIKKAIEAMRQACRAQARQGAALSNGAQ